MTAEVKFNHPLLEAGWRELCAIHAETGGGNALNPNTSPEYSGASRLWRALLAQRGPIADERRAYRRREKRFQVVK